MRMKINDPFVRNIFKNLKWQTISLVARALISILSLGFIANIAGTETVGIYGVVWVFVFGCYSMVLGLVGQSLIGLKTIEQGHVNACFAMSVFIPTFLGITGYALFISADIFNVPAKVKEGFALGFITLPLMCLAVVENSYLQRQLNFKLFSIVTTLATVLSAVIAMLIALWWSPLLGLFALTGLIGSMQFLIYRLVGNKIPVGSFNSAQVIEVWQAGKHFALNSVSGVLWVNSPQLLFSMFFSLEQVGIFVLCRRIVEMIATQVSGLVNSVIFPSFSSIRDDLNKISSLFQKCNFYVAALMMVPLVALGSATSDFLTLYAGAEWAVGSEILFLIVLMQIGLNFGQTVFPTFQAMGNLSIPWKWNFGLMSVQMTLIVAFGTEGLDDAVGLLVVSTGLMPIMVYKLSKALNFSFYRWFLNMGFLTAFGVVSIIFAKTLLALLSDNTIFARLIISSTAGCLLYGGLCVILTMQKNIYEGFLALVKPPKK